MSFSFNPIIYRRFVLIYLVLWYITIVKEKKIRALLSMYLVIRLLHKKCFKHPPSPARKCEYWFWMNCASRVSYEYIGILLFGILVHYIGSRSARGIRILASITIYGSNSCYSNPLHRETQWTTRVLRPHAVRTGVWRRFFDISDRTNARHSIIIMPSAHD